MIITYGGHSCFLVEADGKRVIIDPYLTGNPLAGLKQEDVVVDAVIVSHGHADHIGDAVEIAKRNQCPVIANYEIAMYLAQQGVQVSPMHIGGTQTFAWGRVKFTLALHGSGIELGNGQMLCGGPPVGILLTMGGKTFYHAGDTGLFGDMKLIGELHDIHVAALPIGDVFTMGPEDALIAAAWLKANVFIPMHYNTFPPIQQDPHKWKGQLEAQGLRSIVLTPGEKVDIGAAIA